MRRYENLGTAIEIPIAKEFMLLAMYRLINRDTLEYQCNIFIHDKESGLIGDTEKKISVVSTNKTVKRDITQKLSEMIDNGEFVEDVASIQTVYHVLMKVASAETEV